MNHSFKIGDLVECVDAQNALGITKGHVYRVNQVPDANSIGINDDHGKVAFYWYSRFVGYATNFTLPTTQDIYQFFEEDGVTTCPVQYEANYEKPKACTLGCKFLGDTHYQSCDAYDPDQTVKF